MARAREATIRLRRRLLGYDRAAVEAALASTQDRLLRAETRRDELIASTANVERIGAQVADVLRLLADRAVELEVEAAAAAERIVAAARVESDKIRAEAAAVLAAAELTAHQLAQETGRQQAAIGERRETALVSLQIAIDQMGRLATTIDQIDLTVADLAPPAAMDAQPLPDTVVLLPWTARDEPAQSSGSPRPAPAVDPIAPALARLDDWVSSNP